MVIGCLLSPALGNLGMLGHTLKLVSLCNWLLIAQVRGPEFLPGGSLTWMSIHPCCSHVSEDTESTHSKSPVLVCLSKNSLPPFPADHSKSKHVPAVAKWAAPGKSHSTDGFSLLPLWTPAGQSPRLVTEIPTCHQLKPLTPPAP